MSRLILSVALLFACTATASAQLFSPPCATCPQAQPQQAPAIQFAGFHQPQTFQPQAFASGCCGQQTQSPQRRRLFAFFGRRCR